MKPERRVHSFAVTDVGYVNYQLECGHMYWVWPRKRSYANQLQEVQEKLESGKRDIMIPCDACEAGATVLFALGTPVPMPNPIVDHPEYSAFMEDIINMHFEEDCDVRERKWEEPGPAFRRRL